MRLRTILPLLEPGSSEVKIGPEEANEYQIILSLIQKACIQCILQKEITSARLKNIYIDTQCISIEIQRLSIKFSLNIYCFQFATCCGKENSQMVDLLIGKGEFHEEIVLVIKETISSQMESLMIGFSSEELVYQVLCEMKDMEEILSFRKSFAIEDMRGFDFYFSLRDFKNKNIEIPLQVKTSVRGQKHHMEKFPLVPSLSISEKDSREEIIMKIKKIGEAYVFRQKILNL